MWVPRVVPSLVLLLAMDGARGGRRFIRVSSASGQAATPVVSRVGEVGGGRGRMQVGELEEGRRRSRGASRSVVDRVAGGIRRGKTDQRMRLGIRIRWRWAPTAAEEGRHRDA